MKQEDEDALMKFGCFCVVAIGAVALVLYGTFGGCDTTYSEGFRDGYPQKLSHKGIFFKSWEGELVNPLRGMRQEDVVFRFSVDDQGVVDAINKLEGETLVRLHYRQVLWNAQAYHATAYRVTKVEILKAEKK